jgi:hypothetical protein
MVLDAALLSEMWTEQFDKAPDSKTLQTFQRGPGDASAGGGGGGVWSYAEAEGALVEGYRRYGLLRKMTPRYHLNCF